MGSVIRKQEWTQGERNRERFNTLLNWPPLKITSPLIWGLSWNTSKDGLVLREERLSMYPLAVIHFWPWDITLLGFWLLKLYAWVLCISTEAPLLSQKKLLGLEAFSFTTSIFLVSSLTSFCITNSLKVTVSTNTNAKALG